MNSLGLQGLGNVPLAQTKRSQQHRGSAKARGGEGEGRMHWAGSVPRRVSFGFLKSKQQKTHPTEPIPVLVSAPFLLKEGLRSIPRVVAARPTG